MARAAEDVRLTRVLDLGPGRLIGPAAWAHRLGLFAVPLAVIGTLAHRAGLADGVSGLALLALIVALPILAILLALGALIAIWHQGFDGARLAFKGFLWGLLVLIVPAAHVPLLFTRPAITQVSTDLETPPAFAAALRERPAGAHLVDAIPAETAQLQLEAYPALVQLRVDIPAPDAYAIALELVEARGWRILDRVPATLAEAAQPARPATVVRGQRQPARPATPARPETVGRIEAVARSRVFGFREDVAIRIRPAGPSETRIDMRSAARFGPHDLGSNAARVEAFLIELRDRAAER